MSRTSIIVLEPSGEGGFIVTVPALPEVGTQGDTRDESLAHARAAIELVIEHRIDRGEPVPSDIAQSRPRWTMSRRFDAWLKICVAQ